MPLTPSTLAVDAQDFWAQLLKERAKSKGKFTVIHIVCACGMGMASNRIHQIKRAVDHLFTDLPFLKKRFLIRRPFPVLISATLWHV